MVLILVHDLGLLPVDLLLVLGQHRLCVVRGKATFCLSSHHLGVLPDEVGYLEGLRDKKKLDYCLIIIIRARKIGAMASEEF